MTLLDKAVTQAKDDTWGFQCPGVQGAACGGLDGPPFASTGWPTKKAATARGAQHFAEHKGEGPMQELSEFREDQGLVVADDGSVSVKDL
jgi:hypothetical protein